MFSSTTLSVVVPRIIWINLCTNASNLCICDSPTARDSDPRSNKFIGIAMQISYLLNVSKWTILKYGLMKPFGLVASAILLSISRSYLR